LLGSVGTFARDMILTNFARSSVALIPRSGVPSTRVPDLLSAPESESWTPQLSAVWPPNESRIPSGRSASRIGATNSGTSGWK
jgi:hypothetical protein